MLVPAMSRQPSLTGIGFLRENPGPPDRPEREDRGPGWGRWPFLAIVVFLAALVLDRFLGPLAVSILWVLGLAAYFLARFLGRKP